MPTIEYGGNPSAYADRGTAEHDHENPTTVTATAHVVNEGGTTGRAELNIIHEADDGDYEWASTGMQEVRTRSSGSTGRTFTVSKGLDRDAYMHLRVEVRAETGEILASRSTSVNAMTTPPPVANLTSGNITITVR